MAVVRNSTVIAMKRAQGVDFSISLLRLIASLAVLFANLVLTVLVLNYIHEFVVEPSVREAQVRYHHFHTHVYAESHFFSMDKWHEYECKEEVCQLTMINRPFYYAMLFLWTLTTLREWREIDRLIRTIIAIDSCSDASDMLEFADTHCFRKEGLCYIVALTPGTRIMLCILTVLPRILIAFYLVWLGCRWLSASASFADMVLNSLALEFVMDIDNDLYTSVLPVDTRKKISQTKFFLRQTRMNLAKVERTEFRAYVRSLLWITACVVCILLYGEIVQSVLPSDLHRLGQHCQHYTFTSMTALCTRINWLGGSKLCYPYGGDTFDIEPQHNR